MLANKYSFLFHFRLHFGDIGLAHPHLIDKSPEHKGPVFQIVKFFFSLFYLFVPGLTRRKQFHLALMAMELF